MIHCYIHINLFCSNKIKIVPKSREVFKRDVDTVVDFNLAVSQIMSFYKVTLQAARVGVSMPAICWHQRWRYTKTML